MQLNQKKKTTHSGKNSLRKKLSNCKALHMCMIIILLFSSRASLAQDEVQMVRLAKLVIDTVQLEKYKAALKEEIEASVQLEAGVLTLYAVSEKGNPTHITILEIYASEHAYKIHIQTPHFLKYKSITKEMVKSLELVEAIPLLPGMKIK
jgi:quinol monooxygenase YgiN